MDTMGQYFQKSHETFFKARAWISGNIGPLYPSLAIALATNEAEELRNERTGASLRPRGPRGCSHRASWKRRRHAASSHPRSAANFESSSLSRTLAPWEAPESYAPLSLRSLGSAGVICSLAPEVGRKLRVIFSLVPSLLGSLSKK